MELAGAISIVLRRELSRPNNKGASRFTPFLHTFQSSGMGAASLFRQAIARQLAPIANCSEHHVLRNLAPMPKISPNQQFGIPGPKLGPTHDPRALCQQLAEKVHSPMDHYTARY